MAESRTAKTQLRSPSKATIVLNTSSPSANLSPRFRYYQQLVAEVDHEVADHLGELETAATAEVEPPRRTKHSHYQRRRYEPKSFDLRAEMYRIFGVDLTNVPGISAITAQTILCEIGTDVSQCRNASAFASWLGLCPEKT